MEIQIQWSRIRCIFKRKTAGPEAPGSSVLRRTESHPATRRKCNKIQKIQSALYWKPAFFRVTFGRVVSATQYARPLR